jgi:hypothetical protein
VVKGERSLLFLIKQLWDRTITLKPGRVEKDPEGTKELDL